MFPKTGRIKNKSLMSSYRQGHCLVCNRRYPVAAHVKTQGSGGDDVETNMMPLCNLHHNEQHKIGIVSFAEKHSKVMMWLFANGWKIVDVFGQKKLRKA